MCDKTQLTMERDRLAGVVEINVVRMGTSMAGWASPAETAPTDLSPVLVREPSGEVVMELQRWGAAPAADRRRAQAVVNARSDNLTGRYWGQHFARRRCLVAVTGWFEWPHLDGRKTKVRFEAADGGLLYFPGLYMEPEAPDEPRR